MEQQTVNEDDLFEPSDITDQDTEKSEGEDSPAVEETNEQSASEEQATESAEVSETNNKDEETQTGDAIDEFLAKKGIDPSKPEDVRKLAGMYANAEKGFYQKSQEKAKLERELANAQPAQSTPDMQALSEVKALKTQMEVERWKKEKNLSPETEQKMMDWFAQPIIGQDGKEVLDANGQPIIKGYLYANKLISLDDVYNFVGGNVPQGEEKRQAITEELRNEVKKEMSARQSAKSTKQGSTNSMQFGNPDEKPDPFLDGLGL